MIFSDWMKASKRGEVIQYFPPCSFVCPPWHHVLLMLLSVSVVPTKTSEVIIPLSLLKSSSIPALHYQRIYSYYRLAVQCCIPINIQVIFTQVGYIQAHRVEKWYV